MSSGSAWAVLDRGDELARAEQVTVPDGWRAVGVHLDAETGGAFVAGRALTVHQSVELLEPLARRLRDSEQSMALVACGGDRLARALSARVPGLRVASFNDFAVQLRDGRVVAGDSTGRVRLPDVVPWWLAEADREHVPGVRVWLIGQIQPGAPGRVLHDVLASRPADPAAETVSRAETADAYVWTDFIGGSDRLVPSRFELRTVGSHPGTPLTTHGARDFLIRNGFGVEQNREAALNLFLHGTQMEGRAFSDNWFGAFVLNHRLDAVAAQLERIAPEYYDPERHAPFDQRVYLDAHGQVQILPEEEFHTGLARMPLEDSEYEHDFGDETPFRDAEVLSQWVPTGARVTQVPPESVGFSGTRREYLPEELAATRFPAGYSFAPNDGVQNPPLYFRSDHQPLFRLDRRSKGFVFGLGFLPGKRVLPSSVDEYERNKQSTGLISTTRSSEWQPQFSWAVRPGGIVSRYEIDAPGGLDVHATLGKVTPYQPTWLDVSFWDGIRPEYIRSVQEGRLFGPQGEPILELPEKDPVTGNAPMADGQFVWGEVTTRADWLRGNVSPLPPHVDAETAVLLSSHRFDKWVGEALPTGFVLVNRAEDVGMADALPRMPGYMTIALHNDPAVPGNYLVRGRSFPAAELAPALAKRVGQEARGVVIVSSHGAELGRALVEAVAATDRRDLVVMSTAGRVWQIPGGDVRVRAADAAGPEGAVVAPWSSEWRPEVNPQRVWSAQDGSGRVEYVGSELKRAYESAGYRFGNLDNPDDRATSSPFASKALSMGPYSWDGAPGPAEHGPDIQPAAPRSTPFDSRLEQEPPSVAARPARPVVAAGAFGPPVAGTESGWRVDPGAEHAPIWTGDVAVPDGWRPVAVRLDHVTGGVLADGQPLSREQSIELLRPVAESVRDGGESLVLVASGGDWLARELSGRVPGLDVAVVNETAVRHPGDVTSATAGPHVPDVGRLSKGAVWNTGIQVAEGVNRLPGDGVAPAPKGGGEVMMTTESARELLARHGFPVTPQKLAVLDLYLHQSQAPRSIHSDDWYGAALLDEKLRQVVIDLQEVAPAAFGAGTPEVLRESVYLDRGGNVQRMPGPDEGPPPGNWNDEPAWLANRGEPHAEGGFLTYSHFIGVRTTTERPEGFPVGFETPEDLPPVTFRDDNAPLYHWNRATPGSVFGVGIRPSASVETLDLLDPGTYSREENVTIASASPLWTDRPPTFSRFDRRVYRYLLENAPGGIVVEKTLPGTEHGFGRHDIAFVGGIRPQFIRAVQEGIVRPGADKPEWGAVTTRADWLAAHVSPLAQDVPVTTAVTRSLHQIDRAGFHTPVRGFVLVDRVEDVAMADALPHLPDYVVVGVNSDPAAEGRYLLRGQSFSAEQLAPELAGRIWGGARGVAIVSTRGAQLGQALVGAMAARGRGDVVVLSAAGHVWQESGGDVTASELGAQNTWQPAQWRAANADGTVNGLGSSLADAYASARRSFRQIPRQFAGSPYAASTLFFGPRTWDGMTPEAIPPGPEFTED
jgi:hypothetical protein